MIHPSRKPRLMIAGEFSSGKTRLITGLLKDKILPSNVTSTSLPPMWIKKDIAHSALVDTKGERLALPELADVSVDSTAYCELQHDADFLDHYDIIDTPGNSDPNIPPTSWMRMLNCADVVVWCTNATQAWRQSEKAVWQGMKPNLRRNATLLITHGDRVLDERSKERLSRRVRRDSQDFFDFQMLVSLVNHADVESISDHLINLARTLELTGADDPEFDGQIQGNAERQTSRQRPGEGRKGSKSAIKVRKIQVAQSASEHVPDPVEHDDAPVISAPISAPDAPKIIADETLSRVLNVMGEQENVLPFSKPEHDRTSQAAMIWATLTDGKDMTHITDWSETLDLFLTEVDRLLDGNNSFASDDPLNAATSE